MHIFITGATGYIGQHIVAALLECKNNHKLARHKLTLCVRDPEKARQNFPHCIFSQCTLLKGDFSQDHKPADWLPRLKGADIVINAVGIIGEDKRQSFEDLHVKAPIALFQACKQVGVKQVIQISALGADQGAQTKYHISKRSADESLQSLGINSLILRPSLIYGEQAKSWGFFRALAALPVIGVMEGGQQKIQPLHIDDLTRAILTEIKNIKQAAATGQPIIASQDIVNAVGLTALSFRQLMTQFHRQINPSHKSAYTPLFIPLPYLLMKNLAAFAAWMGSKMISADTVRMLKRGNHADITPFQKRFGFQPRALIFPPLPPEQRLVARTYFIAPLLRISIAMVWIWTALTSALLYPVIESLALLAKTGLTGTIALIALYNSAFLDLAVGVAVATKFRPRLTTLFQLGLIFGYSLILSLFIPELWLHPFAPLLKNLPMVAAIIALQALSLQKGN